MPLCVSCRPWNSILFAKRCFSVSVRGGGQSPFSGCKGTPTPKLPNASAARNDRSSANWPPCACNGAPQNDNNRREIPGGRDDPIGIHLDRRLFWPSSGVNRYDGRIEVHLLPA